MAVKLDIFKCCYCGGCVPICPEDAIYLAEKKITINEKYCTECGLCIKVCPVGAIDY